MSTLESENARRGGDGSWPVWAESIERSPDILDNTVELGCAGEREHRDNVHARVLHVRRRELGRERQLCARRLSEDDFAARCTSVGGFAMA